MPRVGGAKIEEDYVSLGLVLFCKLLFFLHNATYIAIDFITKKEFCKDFLDSPLGDVVEVGNPTASDGEIFVFLQDGRDVIGREGRKGQA